MAHILLVAHGNLADALLESSKLIVGEASTKDVDCLNMIEGKDMDQFVLEAKEILDADPDGEYLILADVFGASPCNSCLSVFRHANYRLITGVNLPILLDLFTNNNNKDLSDLWNSLIDSGKESIKGIFLPAQ